MACLDYSLEHNVDLTSVAVSHLDRLKNDEDDVVRNAIRGALLKEYREYGRDDGDTSLKAFLAEGSAFLRYGKDDPETLRVERSLIQPPSGRRYPLRNTPRTSTPRTRTSRTLSPRLPASSETSSLSLHCTPEFEGLVGTITEQTPRAATTTQLRSPSHESRRESRRKSRASTTATTTASSPTGVQQDSDPAQAREMAETASLLSLQASIQEGRLSALEKELAAKDEELQAALRSITEQQDYIFTLSNRLMSAEKECKEIEHSISKSAEHKDNAMIQENLRYEYSVLRDQNIKMISQREAISLAAKGTLGPANPSIRDEFELILAGLKDACSSVSIVLPTATHNASLNYGTERTEDSKDTAAESWSQRLAGSSLGELVSRASANEGISDIHLMTALAAVGMAELVFESNFPDFLARESPLLDQYREHILTRGQ